MPARAARRDRQAAAAERRDGRCLARGCRDPEAGSATDPQAVDVGRIVNDGGEVRLGNILLTAIASSNGLSWRWEACASGVCRTIVYAGRLTPGDAAVAAGRIAASPCEIL